MPPVDVQRGLRGPLRAYAFGWRCALDCDGVCCRGLLVDMDRVGARVELGAEPPWPCGAPRVRMMIERRTGQGFIRRFEGSVRYREGGTVMVHFDKPLTEGLGDLQRFFSD
ncbi:MAG: hypothetical protein AB7D51_11260 [Desulfovibrionaceae bacterium]